MTQTTTLSPLNQRITGPNQLMGLLHDPQTSLDHVELFEVWLSKDSQCIAFYEHPLSLETDQLPEFHLDTAQPSDSLIVIVNIQNEYLTRSSIPSYYQMLLSRVRSFGDESGLKILDLIISTNSRWWSTLCHSDECCPEAGRTRENIEHPDIDQEINMNKERAWQLISAMVENSDPNQWPKGVPPTDEESHQENDVFLLLDVYIDDITFRDCILSHCSKDVNIQSTWNHILELCLLRPKLNRVSVVTILSSLAYLKNDLDRAQQLLNQAFEIDSTYSLAKLLQQGLTTKAPPSLLASAFSVYTPSELLEKSKT